MAAEPRHKSRKHQIEPLNWAEAAQSPALKGMLSFLDVSAADVRNAQNQNPDLYSPQEESKTTPDSSVGDALSVSDSLPPGGATGEIPVIPVASGRRAIPKPMSTTLKQPVSESLPVSVSREDENLSPFDVTSPDDNFIPVSVSLPVSKTLPSSVTLPVGDSLTGIVTLKVGMVTGVVSSQNRKIRKCRIVQDAHSAGEELLYRILWDEAKPDSMNPTGSRTLRMGYAEMAAKARMHKTNVRLNLANLKAKLAIDVLEEHNSTDLIPRLYRIFSFREILDRRKTAGLEYVIRKKNVVFVRPDGTPISLPDASPKKRKSKAAASGILIQSDSLTSSESLTGTTSRRSSPLIPDALESEPEQLDLDVRKVSEALNKYWTTDEAAAHQLVRDCRRVRPDAQGDEIAFFVEEKLEIARANRHITNPTGLIIATVPQCFTGSTFEEFRRRRNEQLRIAVEEDARKRLQESEMEAWVSREVERLEGLLRDPNVSNEEKLKAERRLLSFK